MRAKVITIATRASTLALAQAHQIRMNLIEAGYQAELVPLSTPGDQLDRPIDQLGQGIFTTTLRQALLQGNADLAVHSYKDLPVGYDERFVLAAVPPRQDPRDALVARDGLVLGQLPPGATIGTSSPRRAAQLRALGLGLEILPLRGNLDSRLDHVARGAVDGIVVARAGLARIGALEVITEVLDFTQMLPAPAQGALAVECRPDQTDLIEVLTTLDDHNTRVATTAERAILMYLNAGCSAPIGALAEVVDSIDEKGYFFQELSLRCSVTASDGSDTLRLSGVETIDHAEQLGQALAEELRERGAEALMKP